MFFSPFYISKDSFPEICFFRILIKNIFIYIYPENTGMIFYR